MKFLDKALQICRNACTQKKMRCLMLQIVKVWVLMKISQCVSRDWELVSKIVWNGEWYNEVVKSWKCICVLHLVISSKCPKSLHKCRLLVKLGLSAVKILKHNTCSLSVTCDSNQDFLGGCVYFYACICFSEDGPCYK